MKTYLVYIQTLIALLLTVQTLAQKVWTPVDIVSQANINSLAFGRAGTAYIGCSQGGSYYYDGDAELWKYLSSDLDNENLGSLLIHSGGVFFASSRDGLLVSRDGGLKWDFESGSLLDGIGISVLAEAANGAIYAGAGTQGLYVSGDQGSTWEQAGIPDSLGVFDINVERELAYFVITNHSRYYRSLDSGASWTRFDVDRGDPFPNQIAWLDTTLIMSSDQIYFSNDLGETWDLLEGSPSSSGSGSYDIAVLDSIVFAGIGRQILMRSLDRGSTWEMAGKEIPETRNWTLKVLDEVVYAGTNGSKNGSGVYRSDDLGETWEVMNTGLRNLHIDGVLQQEDGTLFTHTLEDLYLRNPGNEWTVINPDSAQIADISTDGQGLYVSTLEGLYYSKDTGDWFEIEVTYPELPPDSGGVVEPFAEFLVHHDSMIFLSSSGRGIQLSRNKGESWEEINQGVPPVFSLTCSDLEVGNDGKLYASFHRMPEVFVADSAGDTWLPFPENPFSESTFALAVSANGALYAGGVEGIVRSVDDGNTWDLVLDGLFTQQLLISGEEVVIAGTDAGIYYSTDGIEWEKDTEFPGDYEIQQLYEAPDGTIYAGTRGYGLFEISSFTTSTENDFLFDNKLNPIVAPNPATDYFEVRFSHPLESDLHLNLIDISGRIVSHELVWKGVDRHQVQARTFHRGMYYLQIKSGKYHCTRKIILW